MTSSTFDELIPRFNIYPNPSALGDDVNIELSEVNQDSKATLALYSISGQILLKKTQSLSDGKLQLSLAKFEAGLFYLSINVDDYKEVVRLIVIE